MKKTLIALAVAGVVVAPAAMADVTVYGQANVSVGQDNNGKKSYTAVNSNSSRFGIKAAESLDGGLTAVAQMEFGVAMDEGGAVSGRNQFVGLAGGFGTVLAGRHDAPNKMSTGGLDVFADSVGDYNAVVGANGATDVRADNAIAYVSPAISGATIVLAYVPSVTNEQATQAADPKVQNGATSAAILWGQGPLSVNFGYLKTGKDFDLGNAAAGFLKGGAGVFGEVTDMRVGVGFQVNDALKVAAIYNTVEDKLGGAYDGNTAKYTAMLVNAAYSIGGGNTIKAEYGMLNDNSSDTVKGVVTSLAGGVAGTKDNGTLMAVGLDHAFSKNTTGYIVYASMSNEKNARWSLGVNGSGANISAAASGKDPNAIEAGMVVKF